jgi:hypothetical protein
MVQNMLILNMEQKKAFSIIRERADDELAAVLCRTGAK